MDILLPATKIREYYDKLEAAGNQKETLELELAEMRIAAGIKLTKEQIIAWLKSFCRGELLDDEFQRRIIDVFVNSVFIYDDKIVIYYNVKGSEQVSFIEMLDSSEEPPYGGDPELCNGVRISNTMVELRGFEPLTPAMRTQCSPS